MTRKLKSREQLDQESAARHNARNADRWALWAGAGKLDQVVEIIDGREVAARREKRLAYFEERKERTRRKAALYRQAVAELVSPEELAQLDERRLRYPKGPEYSAEMFCTELANRTGRAKLDVFQEFESRVDAGSDMVRPGDDDQVAAQIRARLAAIARKD
jgi:hypothetical protein